MIVEQLARQPLRERVAVGMVAVCQHDHLGAHLGHVRGAKAVHDGDVEHVLVLALDPPQLFDEALHRLARGRQHVDHPAVVGRKTRRDLALQRAIDQADQLLRTLRKIDMREFLVEHRDVERLRHFLREMAVRVELGRDQHFWSDDRPRTLQQVAFAVVVTVRDHRAVQAEDRGIEGQRVPELLQDLVAQRLVGLAVDQPARCGRGGRALDQRPARGLRAAPGGNDRARDHGRPVRVLARTRQELLAKALEVERQGRIGVDLGGERGGEHRGHGKSLRFG